MLRQVKQELYEQAIPYFARAAEVQPLEAKWKLMVASCHRRLGSFQQVRRRADGGETSLA